MAVKGNDLAPHKIKSVLLKKFGETPTRGALMQYSLLAEHSIDYFEILANSFIKSHVGARKVQAQKDDIFRIAQGESELLREFITRFQKERILLPVVLDECAAEALTKGLNPRSSDAFRKLKESLLEFQAMTWADVYNQYKSKIRIEDDQVGFPSSTKGQDKNREKSKDDYDSDKRTLKGQILLYEWTEDCGIGFRPADKFIVDRKTDRGRNNRSLQDKEVSGSWDPSYPKLSKYKFNVSMVELVSALRNIKEARFLRYNVEPSKAGEELPCQMINMIFGGNEINRVTFSVAKKMKVSITTSKRLQEDDITFNEDDADGLLLLDFWPVFLLSPVGQNVEHVDRLQAL
ncbi:uncharacterized protein LOC107786656 [Nicotiana tabacum]|uniref:Uncharacterized protein LOC107786656 n=1 Tax=Nicotiana tabacum TaxID=4097 RepID=A0AC58TG20_TOBAC